MITKNPSFITSDGTPFLNLAAAQAHELEALFNEAPKPAWTPKDIALHILECKDKVLDALTTGPNSKVRARKINGGKRTRRPSAAPLIAELPDMIR